MDPGSVKVFSSRNLPRLNYIADLLLNDILGLSWELVTDKRKLGKHPVINYSGEDIPGSFKICPSGLLSETGIKDQNITVSQWKNLPVFFQPADRSDFPFDIFAAAFYLVTRYEEYQLNDPDRYGRFRSKNSLASRNGFLRLPVIELWTRELANMLVRKYQYLAFKRGNYNAQTTIDADEAFRFCGKGFLRSSTSFVSDIISGRGDVKSRFSCLMKKTRDPYDVFDYIFNSADSSGCDTKFFVPVGNSSEFDENPSWRSSDYRNLIKKISARFETGVHPSFRAGSDFNRLRKESQRLGSITSREIRLSRFHYLRIRFPESYKNLAASGIREDFSMGYSDEPGFRAGISRPFRFFDVSDDRIYDLVIKPFQFMDAMFIGDRQSKPEAAQEVIGDLIRETRIAGGTFTSIWHNTTLTETEEGRKWRRVFEFTLKNQQP